MNKLEGFYKLAQTNLPAVAWREWTKETCLNGEILWTVRCAIREGEDFHLPRLVGASAKEAMAFAKEQKDVLKENGIVIYYPYFVAAKSGVLEVSAGRTVIEAVQGDLWNLVTDQKRDVTIVFEDCDMKFYGDESFLTSEEMLDLADYGSWVKKLFAGELRSEKSVMLEWSFASNCNKEKKAVDRPRLLFYELRTNQI